MDSFVSSLSSSSCFRCSSRSAARPPASRSNCACATFQIFSPQIYAGKISIFTWQSERTLGMTEQAVVNPIGRCSSKSAMNASKSYWGKGRFFFKKKLENAGKTSVSAESLKKKIQGAFCCQHKIVKKGLPESRIDKLPQLNV